MRGITGCLLAAGVLAGAAAPAAHHAAYSGTPIDVLTYHYDKLRTGWNQSETDLTPASVASGDFGALTTLTVDGLVTAQPLLVSAFKLPDGTTHDVLVIVTNNNSVYAFDEISFAILWQVNLGPAQPASDVPGSNWPQTGIASTPVILRAGANAATIYLVAATEPATGVFMHQLHALNLATGQDNVPPVTITATAQLAGGQSVSFNPLVQYIRAGLAAANGNIYLGTGSHGDLDKKVITGWLLAYDATTLQQKAAFNASKSATGLRLGSIWMSGCAPAIDSSGNILFATGNGQVTTTAGVQTSLGMSVISLNPGLTTVNSSFTIANWAQANQTDTDLGSGGVMLLPAQAAPTPPLAVAMGKSHVMYLLNHTALGGLQANNAGALQQLTVTGSAGLWGGPAYFGASTGGIVYAQVGGQPLTAYALTAGATPSLAAIAEGTTNAGYGGADPVVSSNGAAANTALVWTIHRGSPLKLEAYNANTLGKPIFTAAAGSWWNPKGPVNAFIAPLVANGRVYVGANGTVRVFGLTP